MPMSNLENYTPEVTEEEVAAEEEMPSKEEENTFPKPKDGKRPHHRPPFKPEGEEKETPLDENGKPLPPLENGSKKPHHGPHGKRPPMSKPFDSGEMPLPEDFPPEGSDTAPFEEDETEATV